MNPRLWRSFLAVLLSFIFVLMLAGLAGAQVPSGVKPASPQAAPELQLNKSNDNGAAQPGGVVAYRMEFYNYGDGDALSTIVTDTLPLSTTWAGDTSGVTPVIGSEGVITWNLGTIPHRSNVNIEVTLDVDPNMPTGPGQIGQNCAGITSSSPGDWNESNNSQCTGSVDVWTSDVDLSVNTWVDPNDPAPGQEYDSVWQVCNNRNTMVGSVWLTHTVPTSTTLLSWRPDDSSRNLWTEVSRSNEQLVLKAPGLPALCDEVRVRLRVNSGTPIGTPLFNQVAIDVADDVDLNNQQAQYTAYVSGPRYDLEVDKSINSNVLAPGGWIQYHLWYANRSNQTVHAFLTDTLPVSVTYRPDSATREGGGEPVPPQSVTAQTVVWDLGTLDVGEMSGIDFFVDVDSAVTPNTVLTNCATVAAPNPEDTPWNNGECYIETIFDHGPNLRIRKTADWNPGQDGIRYDVQFENIGDQEISDVWITDTLPAATTWQGWWNMNFDWGRLADNSQSSSVLDWNFSTLYPGDSGWLYFGVNMDNSNQRPLWYTNTIVITSPIADLTPADNVAESGLYNGEVSEVDLRVSAGRFDTWGRAAPNSVITVTTAAHQATTSSDGWGNWNMNDNGGAFNPGDVVTFTAGNGTAPLVVHVPTPFDALAAADTDRVWGQIGGLDHEVIDVDVYGYLNTTAQTDGSGHFTRTLSDLPRGYNGEVRYRARVNNTAVTFHRDYTLLDLILIVNSSHDWVELNYEVGHTIWITVTDSAGTIKATMMGTTDIVPWWGGNTGFSTNMGSWIPRQPDIAPGDWVYGALDNGYTSAVHVGTITGNLNVADDSISGTVTVPWFSQMLNAQCWIDNVDNSNQDFTVNPAGGAYACDFTADLVPGQNVSVQYQEPDGDQVRAVFSAPVPHVKIQKQANGTPGEGGNFIFRIYYENNGDGDAENTTITDTLLYGMTYLTDTTDLPHTGTGGPGDPIVWQLGTLNANSSGWFDLFVQVTAAAGEQITNTAQIATSNPYDEYRDWEYNNGWGKESWWWANVQSTNVDLNVGAGTWTWQPAPGYDYIYNANVCNFGLTGSTETILTNTLPLSTSLVSWWGQNPGWSQVFSATHQLIVSRPTLSGGQCEQVFVRVHLDPAAMPNDPLHYTALVGASNDSNSGNDQSDVWHNVGGPYYDLNISKNWNWGQLVPGGEVRYNLNYNNNGSLPVTTAIRITDTLPQNTTFLGAWTYDQQGQHPVTPTINAGSFVVWEIPGLENGFGNNFEIALGLNPGMTPGTVFTNCATIGADFAEYNNPYDNEQCVADTVRASGPNLRVTKTADWQNGGNQIQYRVHLENIGTTSISSVTVTDTYPVSMTLAWWNINWQPWLANDDALNHVFTVTLDSPFNPGQTADLHMQFNVPSSVPNGTLFTNTAEITTPPGDVNPADNLVQQVSGTGPDLSVEKWLTGGSVTPRPGELLTYTLRLANKSTQWGTSGQILITDTLPPGLEFIAAQQRLCGPGNFFCENNPTQAGSVLAWTWDSWCPNCWNDLILTVRVTDTAQFDDVLINTAQIASDNPTNDVEPDYTNNSSTMLVRVMNPKFVVDKVYQGNRVAGTVVTYTLTVTNIGTYTGTNITLIDEVPANLTPGGTLSWTLATLAPSNGTASVWFSRTLSCTAAAAVNNTQYRVTSSDQAVTTTNGLPVSFVIAAPTITTDFSHAPDPVLIGQSVTFTGTAGTNGTPLSYAWSFGDGAQATGLNATHVYTRHGSYTVVFTATDGCGYVGTQTHLVTVNAPALTANFMQSATAIIVNNTVRFTDTSTTNGPSIAGWLWTFGDGDLSNAQHPTHTFITVGLYNVTLLVTDSLGYTATHSVPNAVTVTSGCIPLTSADFTYVPPKPLIHNTVAFTATIQPISTTQPITYAWNFGDGSTISQSTPAISHAYHVTGTRNVMLTVSNACTVPGIAASHSLTVVPYQIYLPLITYN